MYLSFSNLPILAVLAFPMALLDSCGSDNHVALGAIERDRVALTATANEIVIERPIEEGSPVKKGDVLLRLDDQLQQAQRDLAAAELAQAQANLEKLEAGAREEEFAIAKANVEAAQAEADDLEASYNRNLALMDKAVVSEARLEQILAQRDSTRASLRSAMETLRELENGARPEDLRQAKASVQAAKARLRAEQKRVDDLIVVASRDGILDSLPWNLGERVSIGSPVAIILAGDAPYARVYIPEPFRVNISIGTPLEVKVDGLENSFQGKVRWVSSEPSFTPYYALNHSDRAKLMYLAEIELPKEAANLPNGVPAQAVLN